MLRYFWPSDDEQLAGQAVDSHFDEDAAWWVGAQRAGAIVALAAALSLTATSTALASSVFNQNQDEPGGLVFVSAVQEEYWQNPTPPLVWPQPSVFSDDDAHPTFVPAFTPDDGDWKGLVAPVPATNFVQLPFLELDLSPHFVAAVPVTDAGDSWGPQAPPVEPYWTLLFFLDDGSSVRAFQPEDDIWAPQIAPQNWPQATPVFFDTDDNVPEFVAAEDPLWLQLVPPVPASLQWPWPWQFEQFESTNLVAFTTEEYWQNPSPPVPDGLLAPWPFVFEQNEAASNLALPVLEETLWQNPAAPDPGALRTLQQWQFEQNESAGALYILRDEDFWANPVPPVASYPVPGIYFWIQSGSADETIVQQSQATIDELYWGQFMAPSVPPVAPSMQLLFPYQPDPEEIPAGSLFPFVPPPPPFCPLPPSGPDSDIKMSNFNTTGGGPVLALFCRICNSGNPLVVRADYAIWCQDCCAFVSKQDTYMGTTRAPGAFKARF